MDPETLESFRALPTGMRRGLIEDHTARLANLRNLERPTTATRNEIALIEAELPEFARVDTELRRAEADQLVAGRRGGRLQVERGSNGGGDQPAADRWGAQPVFRGDPWAGEVATFGRSASDVVSELRGRARTAIEQVGHVPDAGRQKITTALDTADGSEQASKLARWTIASSDPQYLRAFSKLAADPQNGHHEFTPDELRAYQRVKSEARAMSLTDSAGGYLVPFALDPSVILTNDGSANPIRQIARVVTVASDIWHGVSSAGVTASWDAEAAEVSDDSPTFAQPEIPVWKEAAFVPISIEAQQDMIGAAEQIARLLADAADQLEAQAFVLGTGTGQPTGIVTALTGTASEVEVTGSTFTAADFYGLQALLGARYQANARWAMALATINALRQLPKGSGLTDSLVDDSTTPPKLLGKPLHEASYFDATLNAAASDYAAVYGDWSNYTVVDRIGTTVELIPHLFGANRRPTGQRGWYMFKRVGADSVNDQGFRLMDKSA